MNQEQQAVIQQCAHAAWTGELVFPEIVQRLGALGVERYHTDYSRQEITYYLADGDSLVVSTPHPAHRTAPEFSATDVESAVRQSQRGEHTYPDFVQKSMAAGCVGYFVQITGRRVLYFGRDGQTHTECFPAAPTP